MADEKLIRVLARMAKEKPAVRVLSWDWRDQPDLTVLGALITDLSGGRLHLTEADTGSDQYAIVLSNTPLDRLAATEVYRQWETEEADG